MMLKPFFTYFGGKYRAAPHYPKPEYPTIIEPFAGAAGYSLRYANYKIILVEKNKRIAALWKWLIGASKEDILCIPTWREEFESINDIPCPPEARDLVGFWLNKGSVMPGRTPSAWMRGGIRPRSYWGPEIRKRVANQVTKIKHWEVFSGGYEDFDYHKTATWFIDPPYQKAGVSYKEGSRAIDYEDLSLWCRSRPGQVIVCENEGASWLPFEFFKDIKGNESKTGGKKSKEVIWTGREKRWMT